MSEGAVPKARFAKKTKPGMGKALRSEAELEGIHFNYRHIERIPSSRKAHRFTCLIDDNVLKYKFSQRLFHAYFEKGEDIEDQDFLIGEAKDVGVDEKAIDLFCKDETAGTEKLGDSLLEAKNNFISIVPTIRLDGKFIVPGLQAADVYEKYIKRAAEIQNQS